MTYSRLYDPTVERVRRALIRLLGAGWLVVAASLIACTGNSTLRASADSLPAASAATVSHEGVAMPDPHLTPGAVFDATAAQICVPGYSKSVRDVPTTVKDGVYRAYGIATHAPGQYEVDHLVPLEIGGSNDVRNLWPEPAEPRPGFHEKDKLEDVLHALVCSGKLDLSAAQQEVMHDWYASYRAHVLGQ